MTAYFNEEGHLVYNGMTNEEWKESLKPVEVTKEELDQLGEGVWEQYQYWENNPNGVPKTKQDQVKADINQAKMRQETPKEEGLTPWEWVKDVGKSVGVEALHLFQKKEYETQYQSKTTAGEVAKNFYRYGAMALSFCLPIGWVGNGVRGLMMASKIGAIAKAGTLANKIAKYFPTLAKEGKTAWSRFGARAADNTLSGAMGGFVGDMVLQNPFEDGEHFADALPDNILWDWLKSDDNDTEMNYKFKAAVEGLVMGAMVGGGVFAPIGFLLNSLKSQKALIKEAVKENPSEEALKAAYAKMIKDGEKLSEACSDNDLYDHIKTLVTKSQETGEELDQLIIDTVPLGKRDKAREMAQAVNRGQNITFDPETGSWKIKVEKWQDAAYVSEEEFTRQIKEGGGKKSFELMDDAVRDTWEQRGLLSEDKTLYNKPAEKPVKGTPDDTPRKADITVGNKNTTNIVNYYKREWNLPTAIEVQFGRWENIATGVTEGNKKRVVIKISKDAKNPYAILRSELEHVRDIAKKEVPDQKVKHFSRYEGINEEEMAYGYVYKKSKGNRAYKEGKVTEGVQTTSDHMNQVVKDTWTRRGWLGSAAEWTVKTANSIARHYVDKWKLDNKVKVEFVDGLQKEGKAVDGDVETTTFLGKKAKKEPQLNQTAIDKKKLQIKQLQDQITMKEGGNGEVSDPLDILKEKLRIAQEELKKLSTLPKEPETIPEITIKIDKNAKNPYAELRIQLERARDIAKGELPDKSKGQVFSRYEGVTTDDMMTAYIDKKAQSGRTISTAERRQNEINTEFEQKAEEFKANEGAGEIRNGNGDVQNEGLSSESSASGGTGRTVSQDVQETSGRDILGDADGKSNGTSGVSERNASDSVGGGTVQRGTGQENNGSAVQGNDAGGNNSIVSSSTVKSPLDTATSTKDILSKYTKGEIKIESFDDIHRILSKISEVENLPKTVEEMKAAAKEALSKVADIKDVDNLLSGNDPKFVQYLETKQLETDMAIGKINQRLAELDGVEHTPEVLSEIDSLLSLQENLVGFVGDLASRAGHLLKLQGENYKALGSIADKLLTNETRTNIRAFLLRIQDALDELDLTDYKLNFTTNADDLKAFKDELLKKLYKDTDPQFLNVISKSDNLRKVLSDEVEKAVKNGGKLDLEEVEKGIRASLLQDDFEALRKMQQYDIGNGDKKSTIGNFISKEASSYYKANLLGGKSLVVGLVSSKGRIISKMFTRYVSSFFMEAGQGASERSILGKQMSDMFAQICDFQSTSWQLAKKAYQDGTGVFQRVYKSQITDSARAVDEESMKALLSSEGKNIFQTIFDRFKFLNSYTARLMMVDDEFTSSLYYTSLKKAQAFREAEERAAKRMIGREEILDTANKLYKEDVNFRAFTEDGICQDPKAFYEAKDLTYQTPLSGMAYDPKTGQYKQIQQPGFVQDWTNSLIQQNVGKFPILDFVFPFVRTPANIAQGFIDSNPLYLAIGAIAKDSRAGKILATPEGKARAVIGSLIYSGLFLAAVQGNITGAPPADSAERNALYEAGWQPYSVRVGDKYYSYRGLSPLDLWLGAAANMATIYTVFSDPAKRADSRKQLEPLLTAFMMTFLDQGTFGQGFTQLAAIENLSDITPGTFQRQTAYFVKGLLPQSSNVRTISQTYHALFNGGTVQTDPKSTTDIILNRYGKFWEKEGYGDIRRDVFGNPMTVYNVLGMQINDVKDDFEYEELQRLAEFGYNPTDISKVISETNSDYTNFKHPTTGRSLYDYMRAELSTITLGGKTLQEAVRECIASDEYASLVDGFDHDDVHYTTKDDTKKNLLNDIFHEYNEAAMAKVMEEHKDFTDNKGRTVEEVIEQARLQKEQDYLNYQMSNDFENIRSMF